MFTNQLQQRIAAIAFAAVLAAGTGGIFATRPAYAQNFCGPIDIAFLVDTTASMGGAIDNVKASLPTIIDQAQAASGPDLTPDTVDDDLRLGLIEFKDDVTVHHELKTDIAAVEASISGLFASGGDGEPEASDEAKNTAVNNLAARPGQTGDFDEPWRAAAVKIAILITDARPGGFNDSIEEADVDLMHTVAIQAAGTGVLMSDVFVPTFGDPAIGFDRPHLPANPVLSDVLKDNAAVSGGVFITTNADGSGTAAALMSIIERCGRGEPEPPVGGEILPIDATVLFLAGASNIIWVLPVLAAIAGAVITITRIPRWKI